MYITSHQQNRTIPNSVSSDGISLAHNSIVPYFFVRYNLNTKEKGEVFEKMHIEKRRHSILFTVDGIASIHIYTCMCAAITYTCRFVCR